MVSFTGHHIEYEGMIETDRAVREQVDWDSLRRRTASSPFARALSTLVEGIGVVPPADGGAR